MTQDKTVFLCYRSPNRNTALAIQYQLAEAGFDVVMDAPQDHPLSYDLILDQIANRAHFIILLTPSALERCGSHEDALRRQIEHAIDTNRNLVPLVFDGFEFTRLRHYLTGKLALLPNYQWLRVTEESFNVAMNRLVNRYLVPPLDLMMPSTTADEAPTLLPSQRAPITPPDRALLSAERLFERGFLSLENVDYTGAIAELTQAIAYNPQFAEAYYQRGRALAGLGNTTDAITDWQTAIDLEPEDNRVNIILACILRERQEYIKALAAAHEGVRLNPGYYEAYYQRGNIYNYRGQAEQAIEDYTETLRLNPNYSIAYTNRGNMRQQLNDIEAAIADYNEALRLNPQMANAYNNRGYARVLLGDYDGALDDYDEAIRLNPKYEYAYYNRAEALEKKGDIASLRNAITDYQQYLVLGGGERDGDTDDVEQRIATLRAQIAKTRR